EALVGEGGPIHLVPALMEDRPTPAQVRAVAAIARQQRRPVDLESLTYTEASRIIAGARRHNRD
ncbi:MAG TPA: hypothetical protein VD902_10665, partial [Symbiobacteriaceae bacterium]|nr:hypothetical protein [Symbiobacteriaceae bacterium]